MELVRPGEGPLMCGHVITSSGAPCGRHEIDGLGFCLLHVPEEDLEEAEELAGFRRCRDGFGTDGACHVTATAGTDPPRCKIHGANLGGVISKQAATRQVEARVMDRMAEIMSESGDRLLNPRPLGNPLIELMQLAAEMGEWKTIMQGIVIYLLSEKRIRSAHNRVGEQLRAEVLLFERAQERYAKILQDIARLGIEARLAQIEERQVRVVETALAAALSASGLDLVAQEKARQVLRRELVKVAG